MPYDADPLQRVLTRRLQKSGEQLYFVCSGVEGRLPISEEDVACVEQTLQHNSNNAKAANVVLFGGGTVALVVALFQGRPMIGATVVVFLTCLALGIGLNLLAVELALRPLKLRLRQFQRGQPGWRPKGILRAIRDLGVSPAAVGVALLIGVFLAASSLVELRHRAAILDHGISIIATVDRSATDTKRICRVSYGYRQNGMSFSGNAAGCALMNRHRVGSGIRIYIASEHPEYSMIDSEGLWTDDIIFKFVPALLLALSLCSIARSARTYAPPLGKPDT